MPTASHHIVLGTELARDVVKDLAAGSFGTEGVELKISRFVTEPLNQIRVRAEARARPEGDVMSRPGLRITIRRKTVAEAEPVALAITERYHKQPLNLERFHALFTLEVTDEPVREGRNYVLYDLPFSVVAQPK